MKNVQNIGFKVNTKRDGKSWNEGRSKGDRFERKATVAFKQRKQKLTENYSF
jgi:hypothetical protein